MEEHQEDFIDLFEYPKVWGDNDGDLSVWKEWDKNFKSYIYHIGMEGLIGYKNLSEGIKYYEKLCKALKVFVDKNSTSQNETNTDVIYHSRDIEVHDDKANNLVWIYATEPAVGFNSLYDTYLWFSDVVKQLKTINP